MNGGNEAALDCDSREGVVGETGGETDKDATGSEVGTGGTGVAGAGLDGGDSTVGAPPPLAAAAP